MQVMVTVAKSFDAPIKLLFPRQFPTESTKMLHSMLGLGDIVIPGAEKRNCGDTPDVNVCVRECNLRDTVYRHLYRAAHPLRRRARLYLPAEQ